MDITEPITWIGESDILIGLDLSHVSTFSTKDGTSFTETAWAKS